MVLQKRKAVAKSAAGALKRARGGKKGSEETARRKKEKVEEPEEAEADENEEEQGEEEEEEGEEEAEEAENPEEALAKAEAETTAARRKELKAMAVGDVKRLAEECELETGNKADMVEALVEHEAKKRAAARERESSQRAVVLAKKEELEALALPDLKQQCSEAGLKGVLAKPARVEFLLKQWLENDGVEKGLKKIARDARQKELQAMDCSALRDMCEQAQIDPYVNEVMVERIVRRENEAGRFAKPTFDEDMGQEEAEQPSAGAKKGKKAKDDSMVDALLVGEANRKKELERMKAAEETMANKRKELKGMSVEELKKQLTQRSKDASGKKEELVEALFECLREEEALAARRARLRAMSPEELKQLLSSRGLEASGKKDAMVDALLAHQAKKREEVQKYAERAEEVLEQRRQEYGSKTATELKELCASKGLKVGLGKEERVERLVEDLRGSGDMEQVVAGLCREARRSELLAKGRAELLELSEALGVDPSVKEVLIERILAHEDACGPLKLEGGPPAKRARTKK